MNHSKEVSKTDKSNPIDEYFQCLSYCDIHPKGIDNDCEAVSYTHLTLPTICSV